MHRLLTFLYLLVLGCSNRYHAYVPQYQFASGSVAPNHASFDYWAAHPCKKDPSDSLPKVLQSEKNDSLADVFFIHPTTYTGDRDLWYADINDPLLNAKTDYSSILYQASVFNQHCRVFTPRYRQAHFSAFFTTNTETKAAFDTAYSDVSSAFEAFFENFNQGRPLIKPGGIDGRTLIKRILRWQTPATTISCGLYSRLAYSSEYLSADTRMYRFIANRLLLWMENIKGRLCTKIYTKRSGFFFRHQPAFVGYYRQPYTT
jgi:hypothetical protein